jgi:hypothetical protein
MNKEDIKKLILEAYHEVLIENLNDSIDEAEDDEPQPEEQGKSFGAVLEDATDTMLAKFPTLKKAIIKLQTDQFKEFVDSIDWISPRPSEFRINLMNGQEYILKWTGTGFEANIQGKRYYIEKVDEYQQALDRLALLYREGPMKGAGEEGEGGGADDDFGSADTSGGDFGDEGGDLGGDDAGGEDLGGEPIDFEDGAEPEA